jgi:hypothetical protein
MQNEKPEDMYLNLMKKTLSFMLWQDPPKPITTFNLTDSPVKNLAVKTISRILDKRNMQIVKNSNFSDTQRINGIVWVYYAHTMIGLKRLDNLQHCIETVLSEGIEGDFIETGVWRGGACILMKAVLAVYDVDDRKVFVADSFEGLPKPDGKHPVDEGDKGYTFKYLAVSKEEVENNFRKYGLLDNQVVFLKGWFKDTLPTAPIKKLAILRLDGDLYESTIVALENLYPKLSSGGFCIVDDYFLINCKSAVDDFRAKYKIVSKMKEIDDSSIYWRKDR